MINRTSIGLRIRELRKSRGWSAQKLVDESGGAMSRTSIADLENGRTKDVSLTAALGIAKALGLSVEQLAGAEIPASALVVAAEIAAARERLERILP